MNNFLIQSNKGARNMIEGKLKITIPKIKDIEKNFDKFIKDLATFILDEALENIMKNESWVTGHLAKSGRVEYDPGKKEAKVIFSAPYASYVEFGTRAHTAPLGPSLEHSIVSRGKNKGVIRIKGTPDKTTNPLDWWAWKKGNQEAVSTKYGVHTALGYALWIKIMREGTDPHPYLRPAIHKAQTTRLKTEANKINWKVK